MAVKVSPRRARASCHCQTSVLASSKTSVVEPCRRPPKAGFAMLKQHGSEGTARGRASCHCLLSLSASSKIRVVEPRRQPHKAGFATLKQHGSEGFNAPGQGQLSLSNIGFSQSAVKQELSSHAGSPQRLPCQGQLSVSNVAFCPP